MSMRTVRLDEDSEKILQDLVRETGQSISAVLKSGLLALREQQGAEQIRRTPYEIYRELDLGPGGYTVAPSLETQRRVTEAIHRKLGR